ncbi:MAG: NADH-quinone oxidoreductase subunit A [Elusimicrobiota bacterium]|nr:NADH-quinone oxidoreductase subunit A [Elusimicrobiota bacterium]
MTAPLFALLVNAVAVLLLVGAFANSGKLLGPRSRREGDADMPYETGLPPLSPANERMTVLYWRFAVLFVVFDVDLAFLLPWALGRPALDAVMVWAVTGFVALLSFMLAYFWRKGILECR